MALESFYGGKQGISPVIKKSFWFIEDDLTNEDFLSYVDKKIKNLKETKQAYANIILPSESNNESNNNTKITLSNWFESQIEVADIYAELEQEEIIQEIFDNIMNVQFAKGNEYTDVWYSEYCIIDSPNKNFKDNGKLFRRTLNSRNEKNNALYAEYLGTLRGPAGQIPEINLVGLETLKDNFNEINKTDPSLSYPKDINGNLIEKSLTFDDGLHIGDNTVVYSWYQIDNAEGNTSNIYLGFSIPVPQFEADIEALNWNEEPLIDYNFDTDNPFKTTFTFNIPRGVKGTSVDNIKLKKLGDFENLVKLSDFFKDSSDSFFEEDENNNLIFNTHFFDSENEEGEKKYLNYFNETVNLNLLTGEATVNNEQNWHQYNGETTDEACWYYFLKKAIGEDSLTYIIIKKLITSAPDYSQQIEEPEELEESEEIFFFDNLGSKNAWNDDYRNIIETIKELLILTYEGVFHSLNNSENANTYIYTFFLSEYDGIKYITFDETLGDITFYFYYRDPIKFEGASPVITSIEQELNEDYITFTFGNGKKIRTKFDIVNSLTIQDGIIYYNTSLSENAQALNPSSRLMSCKIKKENNKIYVHPYYLNGDDTSGDDILLGELFDLSFKGILTSNETIELENDTTQGWVNYLNANCISSNYTPGLWIGTENLGGTNNWYVRLSNEENSWAYAGNGPASWPAFYSRVDSINNTTQIDENNDQERLTDSSNDIWLSNYKNIIFGKLSISSTDSYNPFAPYIPVSIAPSSEDLDEPDFEPGE